MSSAEKKRAKLVMSSSPPPPGAQAAEPAEPAERVRRIINAEVNGRCGASMRSRKNGEREALACLQLMRKVVANVLSTHPDGFEGVRQPGGEGAFRQISCASKSFKTKIQPVVGGEALLRAIGYSKQVREFVGHYVLEERGGERERLLGAVAAIDGALGAMAASPAPRRQTATEEAAARREQVLKDIEADRDERKEKMQRRREGKRAGEADDAGEGDRGAAT